MAVAVAVAVGVRLVATAVAIAVGVKFITTAVAVVVRVSLFASVVLAAGNRFARGGFAFDGLSLGSLALGSLASGRLFALGSLASGALLARVILVTGVVVLVERLVEGAVAGCLVVVGRRFLHQVVREVATVLQQILALVSAEELAGAAEAAVTRVTVTRVHISHSRNPNVPTSPFFIPTRRNRELCAA